MIKSLSLLLFMVFSFSVSAKVQVPVELRITESYLELHTGPGSEYRVEHILLTGEKVTVTKQNADWFYLERDEKVYGWAQLDTLLDNRIDSFDMSFDEFLINFEGDLEFDFAFRSGFIEGDFLLGLEMGHRFDSDLRIALNIRQVPGKISESLFTTVDIDYFFSRTKSVVPVLTVGVGQLLNTPSTQVIGGESVSTAVSKLGFGIVFAESKRISFSAGYYLYFPDNESYEEELHEISIGLNYFY